jgi:hypothetical protein
VNHPGQDEGPSVLGAAARRDGGRSEGTERERSPLAAAAVGRGSAQWPLLAWRSDVLCARTTRGPTENDD